MELKSKYNLNQQVYQIINKRNKIFIKCSVCDGKGNVVIKEQTYRCPGCNGHGGSYEYTDEKWQVGNVMTIGKIQIEFWSLGETGVFSNVGEYDPNNIESQTTYMCYETGVGSGTLYNEEYLFPSVEEAQAECNKLNNK